MKVGVLYCTVLYTTLLGFVSLRIPCPPRDSACVYICKCMRIFQCQCVKVHKNVPALVLCKGGTTLPAPAAWGLYLDIFWPQPIFPTEIKTGLQQLQQVCTMKHRHIRIQGPTRTRHPTRRGSKMKKNTFPQGNDCFR